MKKYLLLIVILIMTFVFSAVSADDLSDVKQEGVLRLGVAPDYIPFAFYDDAGTLTGIDVALIEEVGRRMGVQVRVVDLAFDGMIDALNLGQVDVIGTAFAKTEERQQIIDFSRVYYNGKGQFVALNSLQISQAGTLESFRDLRIGVQRGTTFDQWVKTNLVGGGYVSTRNVYSYTTAADEMRALDRKDVDIVVLAEDVYDDVYRPTGKYQLFYEGFVQENYAFGMRKNSTLTSVISGHLTDMIKDGTAQSIANRFFAMKFNEAEPSISRSSQIATPTPNVPVYVVPTAVPQNTNCVNSMVFVSDVTITDGHQVSPGEKFRKTWRVQNTGTCTWTPSYTFVYVSGDQMNGRNINIPTNVAPGQMVDLSVDLTAPAANGTYRGYWQTRSPQGTNFGQTIWVKVRVAGSASPTKVPDGQTRVIPVISEFYPDFYSGGKGVCPTVYWRTKNAASIDISVDGTFVYRSTQANGSTQVCGPLLNSGSHTVQAIARSVTDDSYASFAYTTQGKEEGQTRVIPEINYFYISPDSGHMGDSATVYWSVSNAGGVDISVDGTQIERSYNATGSASVYATIQSVGTHVITLTAHSVTDDATATVYYTMAKEEGQTRMIPSVNYLYVSPDSGYMGDSTTVYWSVSNCSSVDVFVDGNQIERNASPTGSASVYATIQSVGYHTISITAHSVTDDTYDSTGYTTMETPMTGGGSSGWDDSSSYDDGGGWAGSNYYDEPEDEGGWAGSNYYDEPEDEGGWAGSNYYDEPEDEGGWAGSNYYDDSSDGWDTEYYDEGENG